MESYKYKGFISYSHDDERWGSWLHRKLETYRFPRRTVGRETRKGTVPRRYSPVFRDRDELTAGANLGAEIQESLRQSENLIVLCSPRSAQSYWVNEEIIYFKKHNNPDNIFAFIIDGEPFANDEADECFPHALKYELGNDGTLSEKIVEPLAADAREAGDGKRLALLKLLSGLTGLGLDDLVQRDLQRARRRVTGITATALTTVLVMGSLTLYAWNAQEEANTRRADAEGLIEFMLTDLRDRLEPVGKLDIMDAVGREATDYYDSYLDENLGADAIGRRAKAYHLLGDIQLRLGNVVEAKRYFEPAYKSTAEQLQDDPNNLERNFEHAHSAYWASVIHKNKRDFKSAVQLRTEYVDLAANMLRLGGRSKRNLIENADALQGLGVLFGEQGKYQDAQTYLSRAHEYFLEVIEIDQSDSTARRSAANNLSWMASAEFRLGNMDTALSFRRQAYDISAQQLKIDPENYQALKNFASSQMGIANMAMQVNDLDEAMKWFQQAEVSVEQLLQREPDDKFALDIKANILKRYDTINQKRGSNE